ncbi:PASTA domain-containing protein [Wenzhouxiangella sp. XN79A]|uniref:putative Ig domain-containing protein n=1 Tax=Wenzhouxiangella sp. XN79A TaxID=2724193 RepID=UPI00144A5524|nr:putative Ig domain-containing protein [Wenzhouxiangella sp. XN79A]NKI34565.1 PASTA domain-containing protein [Wenzhouxiangella sp. XN79A]
MSPRPSFPFDHGAAVLAGLLAILLLLPAALSAGDGEVLFLEGFEGTGNVPQFVPVDPQVAVVARPLALDIDTSEPANQAGLEFSLDESPAGLTLRAGTGEIDWTPNASQIGSQTVTVRVEDLAGLANTLTFTIDVIDPDAAPTVLPIADRGVAVGDLLTLIVEVEDPGAATPPLLTLEEAPAGMTLDPVGGQLEWLTGPGDIGSYPVRVRATDAGGRFGETRFTVTVAVNEPPVLADLPDRGATPDLPVAIQPVASDPDPGDVLGWSLPVRPSGMAIDPDTGAIGWTPTRLQLGPHPVTVRVTDALGAADEATFEIRVDFNRAPLAIDDGVYRVERGDTLTIDPPGVLDNDTDPNSDSLTALLVDGPQRGSLTLNADGGFDYTPDVPVGTVGFVEKFSYDNFGGADSWLPVIGDLDGDGGADLVVCDCIDTFEDRIVAIDGESGSELWAFRFSSREIDETAQAALADIDLDGFAEVLVIGGDADSSPPANLQLYAFEHDGGLKWVSDPLPNVFYMDDVRRGNRQLDSAAITVVDLDQDGIPEIVAAPDFGPAGYHVWDHEGRSLQTVHEPGTTVGDASPTRVTIVDLDLDRDPEIVVGNVAWSHDGALLWKRTDNFSQSLSTDYPVVANLDDDPFPELVRTRGGGSFPDNRGNVVAWNHDGTDLWESSGEFSFNTAPLTVADVDADGYADVLYPNHAAADLFQVLDGRDGSVKWSKVVDTRSTGASVIDLDRDGFVEVVYVDWNSDFHVWDGRDGTEKLFLATDIPRPFNYTVPVFADVDNDGAAEMIVNGGFDFGTNAVVSVWESPTDDWPPMRPLWNEHRYRVTNVNDDLTIPARERAHWLLPGLNQAMINQRLPEARTEDRDAFTYRASDGELQSNVAEVSIEILPPNAAPRILSTPGLLASPGFEYVYDVLAVDADAGEQLSFSIAEGPVGMAISAEGRVAWTPGAGDLGPHPVVVGVTDTLNVAAYQDFVLEVRAPVTVPDLAGLDEIAAVAALEQLELRADPLRDTFSDTVAVGRVASQSPAAGVAIAAGGGVTVEISRGPVPVTVPRLGGLELPEAQDALAGAGLAAAPVAWANDPTVPRGMVLSQDPPPNAAVPPGSDVALVVSGGPRARITIDPPLVPAGASATVAVEVRDLDGTPLDPQPSVTLSLDVDPDRLFGTPPTLGGNVITTAPDSQGELRVEAAFDAPTPEQVTAPAAILPAISDGPGGTVFTEFAAQLEQFDILLADLIDAVAVSDGPAIEALDQQLAALEADIDLRRLRTLTPIAPDGGVPPTAAQAQAGGLARGSDDRAYAGIGIDLLVLFDEIAAQVRGGTVPDAVLNLLNQDLAATAAARVGLDPSPVGVLEAAPAVVALLGTSIPRLVAADIGAVRQALRDEGILAPDGTAQAGRFTLPGILTASSIRTRIIKTVYVPYLGEAARMLGAVAAADLLQTYTNAGALVGIITGASQAIHVFDVAPSALEGFGFDPTLSPNNAVTMIGPALFAAASDAASALSSASDVRDVNSAMDAIQGVLDAATGLDQAWDDANSMPIGVARGCILDGTPGCRQLIYPDGFASVYEADGVLSLPGPVLIVARNLESGSWAVFVANFVPTAPEG